MIVIQKADEVVGKVIDLKKVSNKQRRGSRQEERQEIIDVVTKMVARGDILTREKGKAHARPTDDPKLREDFGKMLYLGADERLICTTLGIAHNTYLKLKRQHLDANIESLVETGAVGMVALGFDKLDYASRRTMQLIAGLEGKSNSYVLMHALRLLKEIEGEKIRLLVQTGAIQVKKKVEISGSMDVNQSVQLMDGDKAQRIMLTILGKLAAEDDVDTAVETTCTTPLLNP